MATGGSSSTPEAGVLRSAGLIAAVLALTGAIGTLFYVAGLLNQIAYLGIFGATWLAREIGTVEIFRGGFQITPSVLLILLAIAWLFRSMRTQRGVRKVRLGGTVSLACTFAIVAVEQFFDDRLLLQFRPTICVMGAVVASLAAAFVSMFTIVRASSEHESRFRTVAAGTIVIALLFVAVPMFAGRARALADLASPSRLPRLAIMGDVREYPVLVVTQDRVYCLASWKSTPLPTLRVIKWDSVVSVAPPSSP